MVILISWFSSVNVGWGGRCGSLKVKRKALEPGVGGRKGFLVCNWQVAGCPIKLGMTSLAGGLLGKRVLKSNRWTAWAEAHPTGLRDWKLELRVYS